MKIIQIQENFEIDPGAPMPVVLSDELYVYLIFYVRQNIQNCDGKSVHVRSSEDQGIVSIKFPLFKHFKFGRPNDEAIEGHPLYHLGLKPYAIQKLENSDWIEKLRKMNTVHPNHSDSMFEGLQHYIFFFHDRCFEIVSKNYEILADSRPTMKEEIQRISALLN